MPTRGIVLLALATLVACTRTPGPASDADTAPPARAASNASARPVLTAGDREFPVIPAIVVPQIIGVSPAQRTLEAAMKDVIDPIAGISVRPAPCEPGHARVDGRGVTAVDDGVLTRAGEAGIFRIGPDGSGTANFQGGIVTVNADGSGSINGNAEGGGDDATLRIEADGSGAYNGVAGIIVLDGRGGGTWNGRSGVVRVNGDGSGTWNGPVGIVTINADGSGTWNAPHGLVRNFGDGSGTVGAPPKRMAMAPLPKVAKAPSFPLLKGFKAPPASCGFVITLEDRVLFDFDRAEVRPDAARVLDVLATALAKVDARAMDVHGHTDAKGTDAYNQRLSEQRAQAVVQALRQRGAAQRANARGFGESQPVAPNSLDGQDNPAGRQSNRRVEIVVLT